MINQKIALLLPMLFFLCIDLIILINAYRNKTGTKSHLIFMQFAVCVLLQQGISSITYIADFGLADIPIFVRYVFMILAAVLQTSASYYWFRYFMLTISGGRSPKITASLCYTLPIFLIFAVAASSPWTKAIIYYDEQGVYHNGSLVFLQVICPYLYIVMALICAAYRIKRYGDSKVSSMLRRYILMVVPAVVGVMMQFAIGRYGYVQIGISIGLLFMYFELYMDEIDENNRLRGVEELNHSLERQMSMIQSLSKVYYSTYYVDIEDDSFVELSSKDGIRSVVGTSGRDAQNTLNNACNAFILPKYRDKMTEFYNLSTLADRLAERNFITIEYEGAISGWSQAYFIADKRDAEGKVIKAFLAVRVIHDEKAREAESNAIIDGLSREYHTVLLVDKETHRVHLIRSSGSIDIRGRLEEKKKPNDYDSAFREYIENYVEIEDRMRMKKETSFSEVIDQLSRSNTYSVNYLRRNEDGHVGYHQVVFINADTKNGKKQFVYGFRDIDKIVKEEQALKEELKDAKRAAEAANKSKTIFLNNMSHDIRTPMNAIIGFAQLLEKEKDNPETVSDYVTKIKNSGEYLLTIINNILDMASIESGKVEVDNEFFDLSDRDMSVIPLFEEMFRKKKLSFSEKQDITHRYVYLDRTKVQQISINILGNAVKYTPEGGSISLEMKEVPCGREGYATYVMTISDTGIGMSPEFLEHIFDYFSRERNTTESKIIGTGLGMSIVKKLVELMGGTIEVASTIGEGTAFTVTLTHQIAPDPNEASEVQAESGKDYGRLRNRRILLAEDNDLNAEIAMLVLENAGIISERAEDGTECIKMLSNARSGYYDAILMDIQMPNLNGYDATQRIRTMDDEKKAGIPIIAMTANAFDEDRKHAYEVGMNGHIAKPIDVDVLLDTLLKNVR